MRSSTPTRGDIDEAMEAVFNDAMAKETHFVHQQSAPREPAEQVCDEDEHILIGLLRKSEVAMFPDKFTRLAAKSLSWQHPSLRKKRHRPCSFPHSAMVPPGTETLPAR